MDTLRPATNPHCPDDGVVMRDVPGGWLCPECGHVRQAQDADEPTPFDGPSIHGG